MDRKDLKIQALLEKVSSLTTQYENQVADLRVELTVAQHEAQEREQALTARINELESPDVEDEQENPEAD